MMEHLALLTSDPDAKPDPLTLTYRMDIVITKQQSQGLVFHYKMEIE